MKAPPAEAGAVAAALNGCRFAYSSEKDLQEGVAQALLEAGLLFERERSLGKYGVVDFLAGRTAVEIKTQGSPSEVARQLIRYCECPDVDALVLVTGRVRLGRLPAELAGKPVVVVALWKGML